MLKESVFQLFQVYMAWEIGNRALEALLSRGVPGNFLISGFQKWRFLDSEHKFPIISAPNIASISKRGL